MLFSKRSWAPLVVLVSACIFIALIQATEAGYRKPPFNGSIFGKRSGNIIDNDASTKALSAMCELAIESCQSWFPQDKK